jgi:hypothetical protein
MDKHMSTHTHKPLHNDAESPTPARSRVRIQRWLPATGFGVAMLAFGLLLWARFILVSGHPRTAIADPPAEPAAPAVTAATSDPAADDHDDETRDAESSSRSTHAPTE